MQKKLAILVWMILLVEFFSVGWAGTTAYRMTLTIWTDRDDEFPLEIELDERQFKAIENDPTGAIQPYLLQARKLYADKIGYRKEIYGEENYKMVKIARYTIVIRDFTQGRVVLKKT